MTATTVFPEGNYQTVPFILSDTSETTILSGSSEFASFMPVELWVADDGGAARSVTVKVSIRGTEVTLVSGGVIAANTPLQYNFTGLAIGKNDANTDTVKLTASAGGLHGYIGYIAVGKGGGGG